MSDPFWAGRSAFVTGHTGFKGSWLSLWLSQLGARVHGYALPPPTTPSLFEQANLADHVDSTIADVRDVATLVDAVRSRQPEVIFHLAAQSIVRIGYDDPVGTYSTNVMGTVAILEAARSVPSVKAVVIVTTDKCYENDEAGLPYRETDRLGGRDPYSNSKACAELVTAAYRQSFFGGVRVASVRAGNVVGGGDWARDRIIPDLVRAFIDGRIGEVRNPMSVRPWQHVLEPIAGYLQVAKQLMADESEASGPWNFGPADDDTVSVQDLVTKLAAQWGDGAAWQISKQANAPHEARMLRLDSSKARNQLGWRPRLSIDETLEWIVEWHKHVRNTGDALGITREQIARYASRP